MNTELDFGRLTIRHTQVHQPWTVPYTSGVNRSAEDIREGVPHIMISHCALHVQKTAGKIAAVCEALDHGQGKVALGDVTDVATMTEEQRKIIRAMSADLVTEALRFANLLGFDLAEALHERVIDTNKTAWPNWTGGEAPAPSGRPALRAMTYDGE